MRDTGVSDRGMAQITGEKLKVSDLKSAIHLGFGD